MSAVSACHVSPHQPPADTNTTATDDASDDDDATVADYHVMGVGNG